MQRIAASLYVRLALVLLAALGASYATMYVLFLSHLEDSRNSNIARSIASRVQLIEELLHSRPAAELLALKGMRIADAPPAAPDQVPEETLRYVSKLKANLTEEMGREVALVPATRPEPGVWIGLSIPDKWLLVTVPRPHSIRSTSLISALLVGFAVFLAGGMVLLWQIQRPLKRLGKALEAVGNSSRSDKLSLSGSGEIRVLGERFNEMVERLHRFEEDRATMLAGVAHDLRMPITRLRLLMELEQGSRQDAMIRNIDDIERITEQFLVYARGSGAEPVEERDARVFVEEVVAPAMDQGAVSVSGPEGIIVAVRANSMRRALANLVDNAIEYGLPPVVVRISLRGNIVAIAVEDAGRGIEPDKIEQALRPFSRLDSSRSGKGHCGLGLVIAAKIVAEHRGELKLGNLPGGGFAAEIRLPVTDHQDSLTLVRAGAT